MARSKQKKVRRNLTRGKSESLAPIPKACIGRIECKGRHRTKGEREPSFLRRSVLLGVRYTKTSAFRYIVSPLGGIDDVINRGSFPFRSRRRNRSRSPGKGTAGKGERKTCDERCSCVRASVLRRPRGRAAEAAQKRQEQFDKSAAGRAARAQIAATKKSIEPSKGEPVLKGVVVAVADGMITLFLWIINSKVINYCFSFP
ncbi:uncharacterized protein LOC103995800 isoform X2 [Musa acuminata AAA Group]|uniref:uncharacterized protein LOC103995800 isoform X2 n=1 Tax=Musa acuminata AAA Group TaxID=214697 RepID=UPI0031DCAE17